MQRLLPLILALVFSFSLLSACAGGNGRAGKDVAPVVHPEGAESPSESLDIPIEGSLQNPAWSPDGGEVLFTRFNDGYNEGSADLLIYDLDSERVRTLVSDGSANINLPGSSWNGVTGQVVFSSDAEPHDEIYAIDAAGNGGDETRITDRSDEVAYEPSLSPDGQRLVFESHRLDVEGNGVIVKSPMDGSGPYLELTAPGEDCRQPNWSPRGGHIVYQKLDGGQWHLWLMDEDGGSRRQLTSGKGDETDASFSLDGKWLVFSYDGPETESAQLRVISVDGGEAELLTGDSGYHGAPSWSPDGSHVVYEYSADDPDDSAGTVIRVIDLPARFTGG